MSLAQIDNPTATGQELAEQGMEKVLAHELEEWKDVAMKHVRDLPPGFRFTSEWLLSKAGAPPKHVNSMGAVLAGLRAEGYIKWTGEVRRSTLPSRHAGLIRVWERIVLIPKFRAPKVGK